MLFEFENKLFSKDEIISTLNKLDVKIGDDICVHNQLFKFGSALRAKNEFLAGIIDALSQSVGADKQNGTLLIPTFTYKFCQNAIYDKNASKCEVGALGEYFRKRNKVLRTNDPIFNFAVLGKNSQTYNMMHDSCFGKNSSFEQMIKNNAKIIAFGSTNMGTYTLAHYSEEFLGVPYRYYKNFNGTIIDESGVNKNCSIKYFVRKLDERSILSVSKIKNLLLKEGVLKNAKLGGGEIGVMCAKELFEVTLECMKKDFYLLLRD